MKQIYNLDEKDKITGEIYVIKNIINNMLYVGQTVSHRKNKNKYRPFGYISRFKDHISEAINNTKKKQCTYLNNARRKYGKENFIVELVEECHTSILDDREIHYIDKHNSLYPNGYNLTTGGKTFTNEKIINDSSLKKFGKRGRNVGYKHNEETKKIMSERLKEICSDDSVKLRMKKTMVKYYDNKKIDILKNYKLIDDAETYIKPVKKKGSDDVHDYIIKINGRKLTAKTDETPQEKYDRFKNILQKVLDIQKGKNYQNNNR